MSPSWVMLAAAVVCHLLLMLGRGMVRVGMGGAAALIAAWAAGCSSDSNAPSSSSGTLPDASFTVDSSDGGSSSGEVDSGGGTVDGGTDAAPAGDFTTPGVGIANFYDSGLDLCVKATGTADFTGPLYGAEGGVAIGSVGVFRPVPVGATMKVIVAGAGCAGAGLYTPGSITSSGTPRVMLVMRKQPFDDGRLVIMRGPDHVAGKDNVYYGRLSRDATFTPTGGAAITIEDGAVTKLDPDVTGTLLLTAAAGNYTKQLKTAAGVSMIIETPTDILVCDLLAPPNGHLVPCGGSVRAP